MRVRTVQPDEIDFVTNLAEFDAMTCVPAFFLLSLGLGLTHARIDTMIHCPGTGLKSILDMAGAYLCSSHRSYVLMRAV